jgi:hypothetical protein
MSDKKVIDQATIDQLEVSKKAVLKRVAENLKSQKNEGNVSATHSSHTSGGGRTHSSLVTA